MCVPERAPALLLLLEYVQFPAIGVTRGHGLSSCRVLLSRSFPLPTSLAHRLAVHPGKQPPHPTFAVADCRKEEHLPASNQCGLSPTHASMYRCVSFEGHSELPVYPDSHPVATVAGTVPPVALFPPLVARNQLLCSGLCPTRTELPSSLQPSSYSSNAFRAPQRLATLSWTPLVLEAFTAPSPPDPVPEP